MIIIMSKKFILGRLLWQRLNIKKSYDVAEIGSGWL